MASSLFSTVKASYIVCPPLVVGVTEQTLPLKAYPFIPCEHPFSILSIIHDELDAHISLTALLPD